MLPNNRVVSVQPNMISVFFRDNPKNYIRSSQINPEI